MKLFRFQKSFCHTLMVVPGSGGFIPPEIANDMSDAGKHSSVSCRELIPLCEGAILRDIGIVASNASPYVVKLDQVFGGDADRVIGDANADIHWSNWYSMATPDGDPIYDDPRHVIDDDSHRLRQAIFYRPFHDLIKKELARIVSRTGFANLVIVRGCSISHGQQHVHNQPTINVFLKSPDGEIEEFEHEEPVRVRSSDWPKSDRDSNAIWLKHASDQVRVLDVAITKTCYLSDQQYDTSKAETTRRCLLAIIDRFADCR